MRLPPYTTIDLHIFEDACLSFISLVRVRIEPGGTILDHDDEVAEAVEAFSRGVYDRFDVEPAVRYALAWLLNLDEARFTETATRMNISFPVHGDFATLRRFLELLWDGTFADWRVRGFDPDDYKVEGLRAG